MTNRVRHPLFARLYAKMSPGVEKRGGAELRAELLDGLDGRVIEIGCGNGLNFSHYRAPVQEVIGVEPEPYLRDRAFRAAARAEIPVRIVDATAESLPFDDHSFDAAVASLVLCSVPNPDRALAEARRVLRPGGALRFFEHVRSATPAAARLQRGIDVVWPRLGGGCHTSRDTRGAIEEAGFAVERIREFSFRPSILAAPVTPHIIGLARRP